MDKEFVLLTLVIPVYNVEKYINCCIQSVSDNQLNNIEILIIDDGSTDSSGVICDEWSKKDARIRIIHKKNGGLSSARNLGLEYAKGTYIWFIDSDDYIAPNALPRIVEQLSKNSVDCIICNIAHSTEEDYILPSASEFDFKKGNIETVALDERGKGILSVCSTIFFKELLDKSKLRFRQEYTLYEDACFNMEWRSIAQSYLYCEYPVYYYRVRKSSMTHLDNSELYQRKRALNLMKLCQECEYLSSHSHKDFFKQYGESWKNELVGVLTTISDRRFVKDIWKTTKRLFDSCFYSGTHRIPNCLFLLYYDYHSIRRKMR